MSKLSSRDLLLQIGIGQFNATQVIPYLMIAPATTDPRASQIILLVRHLQSVLFALGATDVANTGYLDAPTANALRRLVGPNWERMTWATNLQQVLAARQRGQRLTPVMSSKVAATPVAVPVAVGGPLDFLPDVPGGLVTYGVAGYLLYRYFAKGAR